MSAYTCSLGVSLWLALWSGLELTALWLALWSGLKSVVLWLASWSGLRSMASWSALWSGLESLLFSLRTTLPFVVICCLCSCVCTVVEEVE